MQSSLKNKFKIKLIIPSIIVHNLDPHTGIPFMPHMAAYVAGAIDENFFDLEVIDSFGSYPFNYKINHDFLIIGKKIEDIKLKAQNADAIILYCRTAEDFFSVEEIIKEIKKSNKNTKIVLIENIQTVNSFSLEIMKNELFHIGADLIMLREPEKNINIVLNDLLNNSEMLSKHEDLIFKKKNEIIITKKGEFIKNLDEISFPKWEKFDLKGYWKIGFAHAPIKRKDKFLPLLTSRGCPFRCKFCISPTLNPNWRSRSAKNVVDEIEYFNKSMNINDFHISDLDPTVSEKRIIEICNLLLDRKIKVSWKLAQGTKIETIKKLSTIKLMKKAGLRFFSFSPESGSEKLMKKLNKPFDYDHAIKITKYLKKLNIPSQACFISGTPDETDQDRLKSINYMKLLVKYGVSEVALFIYTPLPGTALSDRLSGYKHLSELTRTPTWRADFKKLKRFRNKFYMTFFIEKTKKDLLFPLKIFFEIITRNYNTKMTMSFYKLIKLKIIHLITPKNV